MSVSTKITDYVGQGLHAARPAAPFIPTGGTALYAETDTGYVYAWVNGAWARVQGGGANGRRRAIRAVTGGGTIAVTTADDVVELDTAPGATLVHLPAGPSAGDTYTVSDGTGHAGTNPITIATTDGTLINAAATRVIALGWQSEDYTFNGTIWRPL